MNGSDLGSPGMRDMGFVDCVAAPTVKGIIQRQAGFELREIVGVHSRQSQRCGQQASGLRREIETPGISAPDNRSKAQKRLDRKAKFLDHEIERTFFVSMTPEYAVKIERYGTESFGHIFNLRGSHEQEYRARVDEAADQPWTCDTVNLRPGPGDPDGTPVTVQRRKLAKLQQRQPGFYPALKSVFEHIGINARVT